MVIKIEEIDPEELEGAKQYDDMIPWDTRLAREIPLIAEKLNPGRLLDVACSSGRHTFALEQYGFSSVGLDLSKSMIYLAQQLAAEKGSNSHFIVFDAADPSLLLEIQSRGLETYFDNAILLGNAIANLGNEANGRSMLRNIYFLLRPGGILFTQTVNRPLEPHYMPIRRSGENLVQRIMIPAQGIHEHNVELHVNVINGETGEYIRKRGDNKFFMYTKTEFEKLVHNLGFEVLEVFGGYSGEPAIEEDGATLVWVLKTPDLLIYEETKQFFRAYNQIDETKIRSQALKVWQKAMLDQKYFCVRGFRFLYPRITSHIKYKALKPRFQDSKILDIGCNMGTDLRQMIVDGAQASNCVGFDLSETIVELGYVLYEDKKSLEITFEVKNVVENDFSPYKAQFDIIHAGSLIHLLDPKDVSLALSNIFDSLRSNGVFFGRTGGLKTPREEGFGGLKSLFTPQELRDKLSEAGFKQISIDIIPETAPIGERSRGDRLSLAFYAEKA